jgi:C-terminal processing protease CtpA/Prc
MSGLALISSGGAVEIFRVEAASAAAEAGIHPGDRLLSIDGRSASELSLEAIRAMLIEHGATRSLLLLRKGRELSLPIRLRRRI